MFVVIFYVRMFVCFNGLLKVQLFCLVVLQSDQSINLT